MTYKERYYRDHANDKKDLSVRIIEATVSTVTMVAFLFMVTLMAIDFEDHPIAWLVAFGISALIFGCGMGYMTRYDDEEDL